MFTKPGKVKYSNIHLLAALVQDLYRYHPDFIVHVIDTLMEQITLGLEQNDPRYSQKRLAEVKYLGELYNYKMIDSPVIFDTLYRIVTVGHRKLQSTPNSSLTDRIAGGTPTPDSLNPLDMPDDFFRIRLVCGVLDTCGSCFDRGSAKGKLDFFLTFFQVRSFRWPRLKNLLTVQVLHLHQGASDDGDGLRHSRHLRSDQSAMENRFDFRRGGVSFCGISETELSNAGARQDHRKRAAGARARQDHRKRTAGG